MSEADFRWLSEPVVLNDTALACQDQPRSQRKSSLSAHPSAPPMLARLRRTLLFVIRHCEPSTINHQLSTRSATQRPVSVTPGNPW